ncbi:MAG: hypothetical protein AVDCRST_MAG66-4397 [uncultured Pseudonocardia sp.]|uniref:FAD dependent oxidoreductase domain-containing protein n=1 Tax=uncultured Pseudonocardia sp. TaxID=211455 RepID=A0A6J4QES9_9PSEU|nr:MAG: hypothetical protein AVDCRST_MAG66-4397 [uncultured Pseudonocardia sp.]
MFGPTADGRTGSGELGPRARLRGTRRCDVAVVGAGLTGLSTAVELTELDPSLRVAVLDADHVGAGASGRGTGLLGPRIGPSLARHRRRYGDEVARASYLWSIGAVDHVQRTVERFAIPCDLVPGSQLVVAPDRTTMRAQEEEAEAARELGVPVAPVPADALPDHARRYRHALRYGPAATLDPAVLTEHLARIAERRGVTVHERSAARELRRGLRLQVITDHGRLVADHVVTAINAYGPGPGGPSGVLGLQVQAGVTGRLPRPALDALATLATEPVIEAGEATPYFRLTVDGRMVVGGGAIRRGRLGSAAPAPGRLREAVRRFHPLLAGVAVRTTWAGPVGITRDGLPVVGRHPRDPRLHHASGCNGHGLAVAVGNGVELARQIVAGDGSDAPALPWMRSRAPWLPSGRLGGRVVDGYLSRLEPRSAPRSDHQEAS